MQHYRIALADPVPQVHEPELRSRVFFVSELIEEFDLLSAGGQVDRIDIWTRESVDPGDLERKLTRMIKNDVLALYPNPGKQIWRSASERAVIPGVYEDMVERGIAY